jgi:hypothetical protein
VPDSDDETVWSMFIVGNRACFSVARSLTQMSPKMKKKAERWAA